MASPITAVGLKRLGPMVLREVHCAGELGRDDVAVLVLTGERWCHRVAPERLSDAARKRARARRWERGPRPLRDQRARVSSVPTRSRSK